MKNPNAFLSYTWEDEAHREWVRALATQLRADGVETILDRWHAVPGDQLPQFMESAVRDADYVLIVCTPSYKHKSNNRKGGVGYEGDIMTGEVFVSGNRRKFVPILRKGPWEEAAPSWLLGTYYIDFSNDAQFQNSYRHLADTLLGKALPAPPVAVVRFARNQDGTVTDTKTNLMWGMPSDEQEYPIERVSRALASSPHGFSDWRLPTRSEVATLKAAMDGYFPPPVTLFSKVFTPGAGTMEKGPWNQETINEKSSRSSPFYNPSFTPDYALQAMAESSTRLLRPVRQASDEEA
jgi:hypothetical protein